MSTKFGEAHKMINLPSNLKIEYLAQRAIEIAKLAGEEILKIYENMGTKNTVFITSKNDDSPLTQADLVSHQLLSSRLKELTPDIPVISEEGTFSCKGYHKEIFWLIDPLDGTKEFIARNGEFTVNVALITDQYPIFGVVVCPTTKTTYWGGKSLGAFKEFPDGISPIRVSNRIESDCALKVVVSKSHLNNETKRYLSKLGNYVSQEVGSSLKFCLVAEGLADIYPRLGPTCEWDTAAAQAILEGAGGVVCDFEGNRLYYGKDSSLNPDFIASSRALRYLY